MTGAAPRLETRRVRRGVGYIEFLLAVLMVGLVGSVAIPQYLEMRRKALRAEPLPNLRAIAVAEQAFYASGASWVDTAPNPIPPVDQRPRAFDRGRADWKPLGWYPEGEVRCSYETVLLDDENHVRVDAYCDLDHDGELAIIRYEVASRAQTGAFYDLYPERY